MRALPKAGLFLCILMPPLLVTACVEEPTAIGSDNDVAASELTVDTVSIKPDPVPWTLAEASKDQIVEGLKTCLADLNFDDAGELTISKSAWSEKREVPDTTDNSMGATFYQNPSSPVLLVRRPEADNVEKCAVVFAAESDLSNEAVDALGEEIAASRYETPHGWMWKFGNFRISNDYHSGYEFRPAVFANGAFFRGYNDIRIYRCKEAC